MTKNKITIDRPDFYMAMFFLFFFAVGFFLLVYENDIQRDKIDSALDLSRYYENRYKGCMVNISPERSYGIVEECGLTYSNGTMIEINCDAFVAKSETKNIGGKQ